jgi:hypothetical protein
MREVLVKFNIPTDTPAAAVHAITALDESKLNEFVREFGMSSSLNALATARFLAEAVVKGAGSVDKAVTYARNRMLGMAPAVDSPVIRISAAPVMVTEDVTVTEDVEVPVEAAPVVATVAKVVKGTKGRQGLDPAKQGVTDFMRACRVMETFPEGAERATVKAAIIAAGVPEKSVNVYMWQYYTKGKRE